MRPTSIPLLRATAALAASSFLLVVGHAGWALAASPSPQLPSPSPTPPVLDMQAWLDAEPPDDAPPDDAPPGSPLTLGALLWDPLTDAPLPPPTTFFRLYPATGDGAPAESPGSQDWPGHITATVVVPEGGVGRLEVGIRGSACTSDGCARSDALYDLQGVGPPDGASLPQIATVDVQPLLPTLVAGEASLVDLVLRPKADWLDFVAPDRLVLRVRVPRGEPLAEEPAPLVDAATGTYQASLTVTNEGRYVLEAATAEGVAARDVFAASSVAIAAIPPPDGTPAPEGSGGAGPAGLDPIVAAGIAVVVMVAIAGAILVRRRVSR